MKQKKLHYIQHVPFESLGGLESWAQRQVFFITGTRMYAGESLPSIDDLDCVVILGGPMGVDEKNEYPWLVEEKKWIKEVLDHKIKIVGICLGAQLIASVMGAQVCRNPYDEIGWFPLRWTEMALQKKFMQDIPRDLMVLHWHGDTFGIPTGAELLGSSAACVNQGFIYEEHVLALQFHMEMTQVGLESLCTQCPDDLKTAPFVQATSEILSHEQNIAPNIKCLHQMLDIWIKD